jgi:hypothetical protein
VRSHPRQDPVTKPVYDDVRKRDYWGCISSAIPLAPRALEPCEGPIELDHVHGRGKGKRGPSRRWNLVSLCRKHHWIKTQNATQWRQHLDWYLITFEPTAMTDPEAAKYLPVPA